MADFASMTSRFRASKHTSTTTKITKRPRLVCTLCQISKLRCDKRQPCGNCIKRGEEHCNYVAPANDDSLRNFGVENRLAHLESMVKELIQNQAGETPSPRSGVAETLPAPISLSDGPTRNPAESQSAVLENRPYVGSTHWSAVLEDIKDLKSALAKNGTSHEEATLARSGARSSTDTEPIFGSSAEYSLEQILSQQLPTKVEVDRHLSRYFQGETFIVPFIHTFHFQRQYRDFWTNPASADPLWLSILFSICHLASMIGDATNNGRRSTDALPDSDFHESAAHCLVLGHYHQPQPFAVEALALYAHCKNLRTLDPSREVGAILGIVVRMSYEMGYHRDPDNFGSFPVFEGEMRRRFWASMKQVDLMISFQLGLPSNIMLEHCDTKSPRNLLDTDFDADTEVLPPSRSENEATKLLWFIVKERQMISFSKVYRVALSFTERTEAEIASLDAEVRQMYATVPDVLRNRPLSESLADPPFFIMTRLYIDFIHLKSLCVLHRKYMARGNAFSTRSCIEAGTKLVSQFIDIHNEFVPGGRLSSERWMLTNFTMNDFLLGVMVLCLAVHIRRKEATREPNLVDTRKTEILFLLEKAHGVCVEKSAASRDARRVSHAIRLTLHEVKGAPSVEQHTQSHLAPYELASTMSPMQSETMTNGTLYDSPFADQLQSQSEEAIFGILDPFNFADNDLESIDWTMFEPHVQQ